MRNVQAGVWLQCMQATPQMYLHDGMPISFEPGIIVQPSGVVHHSCSSLPVVDVHPYFTECLDAHQIVVSCMLLASNAAVWVWFAYFPTIQTLTFSSLIPFGFFWSSWA